MAQPDDEDDYMIMTFEDEPKGPAYETSFQRAARMRKEGEAKAQQKSKAQRKAEEKAARAKALTTALPETNKGFKMMAKFGYKYGDTLGKSEDARKEPIAVELKDGRSGLGFESEKKRKHKEQFEEAERQVKRQKEKEGDFLEQRRQAAKDKQAERDLENAQKTAERLAAQKAEDEGKPEPDDKPVRDVNLLWRGQVRRRAEAKQARRHNRELEYTLNFRLPPVEDDDDDYDPKIGKGIEVEPFYSNVEDELESEDPELAEFEALPVTEQLQKVLVYLRETFHYCFYCGYEFPDAEMEGCPGVTEEDHD